MNKGLLSSAGLAMALAGCVAPGIRFNPPAGAPSTLPAPSYTVDRITPTLLATLHSAAIATDTPAVSATLQSAVRNYTYHVGPHDVLNIIVWNHPELTMSQSVSTPVLTQPGSYLLTPPSNLGTGFVVSAEGSIYFPYAGTLQIAGKTLDEIRAALEQALVDYSKTPQVDVQVVGFRSQTYQIAGAVERPGLYALTDAPLTVSQAVAMAGGEVRSLPTSGSGTLTDLTSLPLADLSHVSFISNGRREVLDLRRFYQYGDQTQDRLVHSGDIIQVPDNTDNQVHVIGEVIKQGNYPISGSSMNLAQLIGEAGGLNLTSSNPARIFVFRGSYEKPSVFWLDARSADAMLLATEFSLRPQDVVYVATNPLSSWDRVISQILPTVQTLYETKVLVR